MATNEFSLMVHGGAGALNDPNGVRDAFHYLESIRVVLDHGRDILSRDGGALEAVEACTSLLEDDPVFNAGCGSVLNEDGRVEMDAAIMDGGDLGAGAVAGVHNIANPVQLARLVLARREHVMLAGEGAMRFARIHGMEIVPDHYFLTPERIRQYETIHRTGRSGLDHDAVTGDKLGTVGAVARDRAGNLAAATSTGGTVKKRFGRVGDSPIVGAGVWADNATCAVSCSGIGEDLMRTVLAKTAADLIELRELDAEAAVAGATAYLVSKVSGRGGLILVDHRGLCASGFTTPKMIRGWIEHGGESLCSF